MCRLRPQRDAAAAPGNNAAAEAISALTNLGYQPAQASQCHCLAMKELGEAAQTPGADTPRTQGAGEGSN
jgi:Holliday junction DNA helicase RuvA